MRERAVILLVDDCEDDLFLARRAFEKVGVGNPMVAVGSGEEAIDYLLGAEGLADREEHPVPDLLLLDLWMPGMSGFEVLRCIRRRAGLRSLIVVVLSASDRAQDVDEAYRLGANSYLIKPTDYEGFKKLGRLVLEYWLRLGRSPESWRGPRGESEGELGEWECHPESVDGS